jgi:hypothetical protein
LLRCSVQEGSLRTEIYEADPFTSRKGKLLAAFNSDYRVERQDELFIDGSEKAMNDPLTHRPIDLIEY